MIMEIAIIVLLFIVGTVASAFQALKYLDRKRLRREKPVQHDKGQE